jgi:hypothetical protein
VVVDDGGEPLFFILAPQFVFYFYPARGAISWIHPYFRPLPITYRTNHFLRLSTPCKNCAQWY